jgi:hypothetical protein
MPKHFEYLNRITAVYTGPPRGVEFNRRPPPSTDHAHIEYDRPRKLHPRIGEEPVGKLTHLEVFRI